MRQAIRLALMITMLVLLASCGTEDTERLASDMRAGIVSAEDITMDIDMTADISGDIYCFSMIYSGSSSSGSITVTAPESISGITAAVSVDDISVTYCETALCVGYAADNITPASAVPVLLDQWKYGCIDRCILENADEARLFAVSSHISDDITQTTWFSRDTLLPVRAEIYDGGYMVISCNFTDVSI